MTDKEHDLLKLDYEKTLAYLDKADGFLFQIRGWCLISSSAILAYGVSHNSRVIAVSAIFVTFCFALLEFTYKCFHELCIMKSYDLENILSNLIKHPDADLPEAYVFGIGHALKVVTFPRIFAIARHPARWCVHPLHALIVLTALLATLFMPLLKVVVPIATP